MFVSTLLHKLNQKLNVAWRVPKIFTHNTHTHRAHTRTHSHSLTRRTIAKGNELNENCADFCDFTPVSIRKLSTKCLEVFPCDYKRKFWHVSTHTHTHTHTCSSAFGVNVIKTNTKDCQRFQISQNVTDWILIYIRGVKNGRKGKRERDWEREVTQVATRVVPGLKASSSLRGSTLMKLCLPSSVGHFKTPEISVNCGANQSAFDFCSIIVEISQT